NVAITRLCGQRDLALRKLDEALAYFRVAEETMAEAQEAMRAACNGVHYHENDRRKSEHYGSLFHKLNQDESRKVFRHHLDHRERALARNALLRQVPQLRDRELITSHRYERVLRRYLRSALPDSPGRSTLATALSAAAVAVHNAALRAWLRAPDTDPSAELAGQLERLAHTLVSGYEDGAARPAAAPGARPAVVVTVLDPGADTEEILASVRDALRR
ncbi:MAG: hypothetical protein ACOC84_10390, partial [Actinomycetota bacterium]